LWMKPLFKAPSFRLGTRPDRARNRARRGFRNLDQPT
jgi:hypothetical protein